MRVNELEKQVNELNRTIEIQLTVLGMVKRSHNQLVDALAAAIGDSTPAAVELHAASNRFWQTIENLEREVA